MRRLFCLAFLLIFLEPLVYARFQPPPPCKNSFSISQGIAEGQKAKAQVYKTMPVLPDSNPVAEYVRQLGAKLVKYAPGYKWPFEFHVVDASDINAFALPGGPIFVNLGTVQAADTEAQLAGVMAHEISHVVLRHSTCNLTKQRGQAVWWNLGAMAAGILVPGAGGALAQQGVGMVAGLTFLKMSRDDERQADLLGTDILYDAGYDPRGLPQFFETIQGKYGSGGAQFLSDHPNPGNRTEYVDKEIATLPPKAHYITNTPEFKKIQKLVSKMHGYSAQQISSGAWRKQGASSAPASPGAPATVNYRPNGTWKDLNGAGFSVTYPGNWQVQKSSGNGFLVAPAGGVINGAIAYGATFDSLQPSAGSNLAGATGQLVASLEQQNAGLKQVGSVEDVLVNKVPGKSVELENPNGSPMDGAEHDWLVTLERRGDSVEYVVFVAPAKDFAALQPTFAQMLRTLRLQ